MKHITVYHCPHSDALRVFAFCVGRAFNSNGDGKTSVLFGVPGIVSIEVDGVTVLTTRNPLPRVVAAVDTVKAELAKLRN